MNGAAGGDQRRGGIQQYDIASRRFLASQYFTNKGGVAARVAARNGFDRGAGKAELLGRDFVRAHLPVAHFSDTRWSGDGDFVESVGSVNHECTAQPKHAQRLCELLYQIVGVHTHNLRRSMCRVRERPKQIKNSPQAQFPARGLNVLHRGMKGWSEQKRDTYFLQTLGDSRGWQNNVDPQSFYHVGRAAL